MLLYKVKAKLKIHTPHLAVNTLFRWSWWSRSKLNVHADASLVRRENKRRAQSSLFPRLRADLQASGQVPLVCWHNASTQHNADIMTTQDNEGSEFPNGIRTKPQRRARARECEPHLPLASIGDALAAAGVCESREPMAERVRAIGDVDTMPIRNALASVEQPQGALLLEAQGQIDLSISESCARKLAGRMRASGKHVHEDTIADAIGAGALALTQWRASGAGVDGERETMAARVAWRAVVAEMSRDTFGDSLPIQTVSDDWLWHNTAQRDESREERAARFIVERQASTRQLHLFRRLANLPCGRGKRAEVIERVGNAASMLLTGMTVDEAAAAAGFNARRNGRFTRSAGDAFCQALRRLGFKIRGHARQVGKKEFAKEELWPRSI